MKLAIVVGHNSASQGAVRQDTGESAGVWTYGIGHTAAAGAPNPNEIWLALSRRRRSRLGRAVPKLVTPPKKNRRLPQWQRWLD